MNNLKKFREELNHSINRYGQESVSADELLEAIDLIIKAIEENMSNCCGANDIYDGNLDNNEGVCADCGEHCEMEVEI